MLKRYDKYGDQMENNGLKTEGEDLIIKSVGYLKAPETFRRKYNLKESQNPVAFSQIENGKVRLIFEWNEDQLKTK